jgi:hypothetical protein
MAGPRETSLGNLVHERAKGVMAQDKSVLSQITANDEIVKRIFHWMAPVCETRQIKLECAAVVSTSNVNDYLQIYYEQ